MAALTWRSNIKNKNVLRIVAAPIICVVRPFVKRLRMRPGRSRRLFAYDFSRFAKYAGAFSSDDQQACLARVIMAYHVVEKGLTMPKRRLDFGHNAVMDLIAKIEDYGKRFGIVGDQVFHAIGCIKEYYRIHAESDFDMRANPEFWAYVRSFCSHYSRVPCATQIAITRDEFYAKNEMPFPDFARARHTSRHYQGTVPMAKIRSSVELAMTAPSACNRQYVKVHCVNNPAIRDQMLSLQNGNRGFGQDADKLLVLTSDLGGVRWMEERNDVYTNAGIFLMNLCYALHYHKLAHCILNWSVSPEADRAGRKILGLKASEVIVALLTCGNAPAKFWLAASPRKSIDEVFSVIK